MKLPGRGEVSRNTLGRFGDNTGVTVSRKEDGLEEGSEVEFTTRTLVSGYSEEVRLKVEFQT